MKFEKYHIAEDIKKSLAIQGFKRPTDIQFKAIPHILNGEDVLAIAQTGTGKTAAFAIPVLDLLHKNKKSNRADGIKCVVMAPTRELAIQINDVFTKIGQHTKINSHCVVGGVEQNPQIAKLEKGIDILVATPGRMFDLVSQGHIHLNQIEILILDEADHMLKRGFYHDIQNLISFLPKQRQTLFFSATISKEIKNLAYSLVRKPIRIQIAPKDPVSRNVNHGVAQIKMDDKRFFLERIINEHSDSKILVFTRTKVRCERVKKAMERVEITTDTIHSDKDQAERNKVLKAFKEGSLKVLIATDVSARGIDIPNVEYVINYDLPDEPENYVHRVGRTGRGTAKGQAIAFCSPEEKPFLEAIEEYTGTRIALLDITKEDYLDTLDFTAEINSDWKSLMKEARTLDDEKKKKSAKRNKKKK